MQILGCQGQQNLNVHIIELQISKSTIPEGIALDPNTKEIYISSVHEDKLTKSSNDGTSFSTVLTKEEHEYTIGVGLDIWRNELYALGKKNRRSQAILIVKDLKSEMVTTFQLKDIESTYFNDLAIDKDGNCYITDTDNHKIYYFDKKTKEISVYLEHEDIKYPNGIAISEDGTRLFIDSYTNGLRILDTNGKAILNDKHDSTSYRGIDGLKYYKQNLYFIINGEENTELHGLYKIELKNNMSELGFPIPVLLDHDKMNLPTTFSIIKDELYILANSQLANLNQETNQIKEPHNLTNTYILKLIIENDE